jgi:hypothetical protein
MGIVIEKGGLGKNITSIWKGEEEWWTTAKRPESIHTE